jgi:WD40 repeat protein
MTADGQRLLTGSMDGTAKLWDAATGRELRSFQGQNSATVGWVAVTPDGQKLITGSADGIARIWDTASGRELVQLNGHAGGFLSVAVTPDGQRVITGGNDGTTKIWDLATGRELLSLGGHTGSIWSLAVTPDSHRVVTGANDRTVKIWDMSTGREVMTFKRHTGPVWSVALAANEQFLVTGTTDGTVTIWEVISGRERLVLKGHTGPVWSVAVTPDCQRLVTGSGDGTAKMWDARSGRELLCLKEHTGPVRSVAVTSDGRRLVTGSGDGTARIWETASPEQITLWTRQDEEAARRQVAWRRPGGSAPGFIKDWLLLAPLPLEAPRPSAAEGLEREQYPGESSLRPRAGERVRVGDREWVWQVHHADAPVLDFNRLVGQLTEDCVAYAVCYVVSETERNDLLLQVGSDDMAKVYLNGQEVYKFSRAHSLTVLDPIGPVDLRKGTNVLVLKVVNTFGDWEGCARFVDREGNPVSGLRVRLTPE